MFCGDVGMILARRRDAVQLRQPHNLYHSRRATRSVYHLVGYVTFLRRCCDKCCPS